MIFVGLLLSVCLIHLGVEHGAAQMLTPRVDNGEPAPRRARALSLVSLWYYNDDDHVFRCAGTLIQKRWVLTASSCFSAQSTITKWRVIVRRYDNITQEERYERWHNISNIYNGTGNTDIALVRLVEEVSLNDKVGYHGKLDYTTSCRSSCKIYGWGKRGSNGGNIPYRGNLTILNLSNCSGLNSQLTQDDHICASGASPCQGDDGGPVFCRCPQGGVSLVAVIPDMSAASGCPSPQYYTRVKVLQTEIEDRVDCSD